MQSGRLGGRPDRLEMTRPAGSARQLPAYVAVGRIRRPHGLQGELVVESMSEVRDRFAPGRRLLATAGSGERREVEIASMRPHKGCLLVRLVGLESREEAEILRGGLLEIARSETPAAPEGAFYYYELIDCECVDASDGPLGRVTDVAEDGGGLLLRVEGSGRVLLVPFVESYIRSIDVATGAIELDLPPGLVEICASTS